jgi:CDP-glucose 4,6-dehydratase
VVTVRAGNVIGGGDYAQDRIVPDCIRALSERQPILVRNPVAVRPWQHVLECVGGYLWLGARLAREGKNSPVASAFNFGPDASSQQPVRKLVEAVLRDWPGGWKDVSDPNQPHEAKLLTLSIQKAGDVLGWHPVWNFSEAVSHTVRWYRARHDLKHPDMLRFSQSQIEDYVEAARQKKSPWTQ